MVSEIQTDGCAASAFEIRKDSAWLLVCLAVAFLGTSRYEPLLLNCGLGEV